MTARLVRPLLAPAVVAGALLAAAPALHALVITEIMYHPGGAVDDRPYEYIEIYNEDLDPLDLWGFFICNGVFFEFPLNTWLEGKSHLVVCADEAAVQSRYGITNTIGSWFTDPINSPSLANGGERIEICNPGGKTVVEVEYNDRGKWPGGADGTGHSLSLIRAFREIDDPDNWILSTQIGGTPGVSNGFDPDETGAKLSGAPLDGNGFILKWLVLGPYTGSHCNLGPEISLDWLREAGNAADEKDLIWRDGQAVNTDYALAASAGLHPNAGTARPTVQEYAGLGDTINFNDTIWAPDPNQVMAYAFVYVDNMMASPRAVDIACASDDAIAVLVNGVQVHANDACRGVGDGGTIQDRAPATLAVGKNLIAVKVFEEGGGWSFRLRLENRGAGTPITSSDIIRITTDPDEGLNFGGGGTPIPPPPPPPGAGMEPAPQPVVINEGLMRTAGARWIELHNRTTAVQNIAGLYVTDDATDLTKARIPAGTTLPARGFRVFTDVELGLDFTVDLPGSRVFVALVAADGSRVLDAYTFEPALAEYSEARIPDGTREFDDGADPTPDAANAISANRDVVLSEVMYHPIDDDNRKEYIELYNRGNVAHDMTGWSLSNGLDYAIPDGTTIAARGYLVIGRDPSLLATIHNLPGGAVIGPETPAALDDFGGLRNRGERVTLSDELGRTVDTVRYHDGGEWARWADGHGSSLELIDPAQDNGFGQAWDASDDSGKAVIDTFSYTARHVGGEPELALLLLSRGITVVDDVSIVGGGVTTRDTPLIDTGVAWRYFKGTQEPPAAWKNIGFADGSWLSGNTGIGYDDMDDVTLLTDMRQLPDDPATPGVDESQPGYMTIFCRKTFTVANPAAVRDLILSIRIDDGFYAYLNGTLVASSNVTSPAFDSQAPTAVPDWVLVDRDISEFKNVLVTGTNVLAVQVHNAGLGSSDLTFDPRLLSREIIDIGGGSEMVTNGTFEANTAGWMIDGTHIRSGRTAQNPITGGGSLKVVASGRGDNKVNRLETPQANGSGLANLPLNEDLLISFKARWVIGAQTVLTHGYEHEMAKAHALSVPVNLGTPGRVNSVTQRAGGNLGPVITDVAQLPAVPQDGESVRVSARVRDSNGIASVTLRYSFSNPTASPTSVAMSDPDGDGVFTGTIPGQAMGTRVVFFIAAADTGGRQGRYPADITQRTHPLVLASAGLNDQSYCVYQVDARQSGSPYHDYRFWMTQAKESELATRLLHSNDQVEGSLAFGSNTIYYDARTRFGGSPFARAGMGGSFRLYAPRDNPLHGRLRKAGLETHHGNAANAKERISHYLMRQSQGAIGVPYSDLWSLINWRLNNASSGVREHIWVPDGDFIERWFPGDDEGDFLEMDDRFVISDTGTRIGNADGRVLYPPPSTRSDGNGANKENYRWFFGLRSKNGADGYANFIGLARVLDPAATSDALFDQQIGNVANVEEMLRMWAVWKNIDHWDSWGQSRGKNCYFYQTPADGRFHLIAYDLELTYGSLDSFQIPANPNAGWSSGGFGEVDRMLNRPWIKRMYYAILDEMVNGPNRWFHSSRLGGYATRLSAIGMSDTAIALPGGFIDQRASRIQANLQAVVYPQVRLQITTNNGAPITTAASEVDISGTAPVEVAEILVNEDPYPARFTSMTAWTVDDVQVVPGVNDLVFFGFDLTGNLIDSDSIRITSTAVWSAPSIASLNPASGAEGDDIEILGTGFRRGVRVFFGDAESARVVHDEKGPTPGKIIARVPAGSGTVAVTVENRDGKSSNGATFTYPDTPGFFLRGDANRSGVLDLSDGLKTLLHLFAGQALGCLDAADANDDEALNLTDAVYVLDYLFRGGPRPPQPFPAPGVDPAGDMLDCAAGG